MYMIKILIKYSFLLLTLTFFHNIQDLNANNFNSNLKEIRAEINRDNLNEAIKIIDKVASKGIIHKNKASNKKSSLYKHTNSLK
mgnify:CR=1 FL=1